MTGTLRIVGGDSSVNKLVLAVKNGQPNPFTRATQFVRGNGFDDGDEVIVGGQKGQIGAQAVFFIASIRSAGALVASTHFVSGAPLGPRRAAKAIGKGAAANAAAAKKRTAKKKAAKKSRRRKSGAETRGARKSRPR